MILRSFLTANMACKLIRNGLLYMRARYYNPYLCRFISSDPSGFAGGLNSFAYANGNPVSYLDPFGLGALSDSLISSTWFNAPTPEEQQMQQVLAGFVNLVTLGGANLISSATTGQDLTGNYLNVADAFEQTLQAGAFVASLLPAVLTDGASLEAEELAFGADAMATREAAQLPATLYHYTSAENAKSILQSGLLPARTASGQIFTTTTGTYTPIEAQMYLGLSPNQGLPNALLEIDTATLQRLGINPSAGPLSVLPTPNAMGYGTEIIFNQQIPASALRRVW